MSLLSVVRDVAAVVGVRAPTSVIAQIGSNRTMFEMLACANEMAQRIAYDTRDWTALRKVHTFVGTDLNPDPDPKKVTAQAAFDLPADFQRMLLTSEIWRSTSTQQPMLFISDHNEWLKRRNANESDGYGEWTTFGGQIHVHPPLPPLVPAIPDDPGPPFVPGTAEIPAVTAEFLYLSKNCVKLASGGVGDRFIDDADAFRLDERLLKLGMTWQWKAQKGSPYAEDLGTYQDAIANAMGREKPAPIILYRPRRWGGGAWDAVFRQ